MALLMELKKRMLSKSEEQLVELLCKPDGDLRLSQLVDLSSMSESEVLETEYAGDTIVQAKLVRRLIAPILLERIGPARFLDDVRILEAVDGRAMLKRIRYLYAQMGEMNKKMEEYVASNGPFSPVKRIQAFGLGGSASGGLLACEIIQNEEYCAPLDIHMGYPESFHGIDSETMVVICSFSGDTEEMLYAFDYAAQRTKNILILSLGGDLGRLRADHYPFVEIPKSDIIKPRESIGYWVSAFLFIISSLGLAKKDDGTVYRFNISDVEATKERLDEIDKSCSEEAPFAENRAKQYATYFLYGTESGSISSQTDRQHPRVPVVFLHGADRAIGKRLANQFGETVEHPVELVVLAEDAHNEIESVATMMLEEKLDDGARSRNYILISSQPYGSSAGSHRESRAGQRMEATLETLFNEHGVDFLRIGPEGSSVLERKLGLLKLLDYARLYASILLGTPPLPTIFMDLMKSKMEKILGTADRDLLRILVQSQEFPISQEEALSNQSVKSRFPALRHTVLKRLIGGGYLRVDSGMLELTDRGKELIG